MVWAAGAPGHFLRSAQFADAGSSLRCECRLCRRVRFAVSRACARGGGVFFVFHFSIGISKFFSSSEWKGLPLYFNNLL